uniref:Putative cdc20/fizzy domain-containing protein n=1 Tax=Corethrella appendiculata TaxID=1370023 RepID=U5ESK2_9DIPT
MNGYTDNNITTNIENSRNCLRRIARHDDQEFSNQSILNAMEKFVKTVNVMDETILVPCRLMDHKVGDSNDDIPVSPKQHHQQMIMNNKKKHSIREILNSSDLFNLYNMLNMVKVDLLWGRNDIENDNNQNDDDLYSKINNNSSSSVITSSQQNLNTLSTQVLDTKSSTITTTTTSSDNVYLNTPAAAVTATTTTATSTNTNCSNNNNNSNSSNECIKGHIRRPSTVSMASSNSASTLSDSDSEISNENDSGIESEGNQEQDKSTELAKQFRTHLLGLYKSLEQMTEAANYLTARYQNDVGQV